MAKNKAKAANKALIASRPAVPPQLVRGGARARSIAVVVGRTVLKKAGGSLVMTVPVSARDALQLTEGAALTVSIEGNRLVMEAVKRERPRYSLEELLAQCDFELPYSDEERAWLDAPPVGRELL